MSMLQFILVVHDYQEYEYKDCILLKSMFTKECNFLHFLMRVYRKNNEASLRYNKGGEDGNTTSRPKQKKKMAPISPRPECLGHLKELANSVFSCAKAASRGLPQSPAHFRKVYKTTTTTKETK